MVKAIGDTDLVDAIKRLVSGNFHKPRSNSTYRTAGTPAATTAGKAAATTTGSTIVSEPIDEGSRKVPSSSSASFLTQRKQNDLLVAATLSATTVTANDQRSLVQQETAAQLFDRIQQLVRDHPTAVNLATAQGRTPLHLACAGSEYPFRTELLELLIANGANAFVTTPDTAETALDLCAKGADREAFVQCLLAYRKQASDVIKSVAPLSASRLMKRSTEDSGSGIFSNVAQNCLYFCFKGAVFLWDVVQDVEHCIYQPRDQNPTVQNLEHEMQSFARRRSVAALGKMDSSFDIHQGEALETQLKQLESQLPLVTNFTIVSGLESQKHPLPPSGTTEWVVCNTGALIEVHLDRHGVKLRRGGGGGGGGGGRRKSHVCGGTAEYPPGLAPHIQVHPQGSVRYARRVGTGQACCAVDGLYGVIAYVVATKSVRPARGANVSSPPFASSAAAVRSASPSPPLDGEETAPLLLGSTTFAGTAGGATGRSLRSTLRTERSAVRFGGDEDDAAATRRGVSPASDEATTASPTAATAAGSIDLYCPPSDGVTFRVLRHANLSPKDGFDEAMKSLTSSRGWSRDPFAEWEVEELKIPTEECGDPLMVLQCRPEFMLLVTAKGVYAADVDPLRNLRNSTVVSGPQGGGVPHQLHNNSSDAAPYELFSDHIRRSSSSNGDATPPPFFGGGGDSTPPASNNNNNRHGSSRNAQGEPTIQFFQLDNVRPTGGEFSDNGPAFVHAAALGPQRFRTIKPSHHAYFFAVMSGTLDLYELHKDRTCVPMLRLGPDRMIPHTFTPVFHPTENLLVILYQSLARQEVCVVDLVTHHAQAVCKLPKPSSLRFFTTQTPDDLKNRKKLKRQGLPTNDPEVPKLTIAFNASATHLLRYNSSMNVMSVYGWEEIRERMDRSRFPYCNMVYSRDALPVAVVERDASGFALAKPTATSDDADEGHPPRDLGIPGAWVVVDCPDLIGFQSEHDMTVASTAVPEGEEDPDAERRDRCTFVDLFDRTLSDTFRRVMSSCGARVVSYAPPSFHFEAPPDEDFDEEEIAKMEADYNGAMPRRHVVYLAFLTSPLEAARGSIKLTRELLRLPWPQSILQFGKEKYAETLLPYEPLTTMQKKFPGPRDMEASVFQQRGPKVRVFLTDGYATDAPATLRDRMISKLPKDLAAGVTAMDPLLFRTLKPLKSFFAATEVPMANVGGVPCMVPPELFSWLQ